MKQCPNCGKDYEEGQAFCTGCGTALREAPPPEPESEPEEPTILIPPVRQQPEPVPVGDPFADTGPQLPVQPPVHAPAPSPAKQAGVNTILAVMLAACAVLAAVCAGFAGVKASRYQKSCELEREQHLAAVQEAARIQEELDKLQLDRDKTAEQLKDLGLQLDDTRGQLEDVSGQLTDGSSRLEEVEQELDTLISLLSGELGYASRGFHSTRDVVVVRKGSSVTVPLYIEPVEGAVYTLDCSGTGNAVSCQWGVESIVYGENPVIVTGSEVGCYTFYVRNDAGYGESFRMLVIVTE